VVERRVLLGLAEDRLWAAAAVEKAFTLITLAALVSMLVIRAPEPPTCELCDKCRSLTCELDPNRCTPS
jgi:hypothetical protein